jgi:hypothetical protein
VEPGKVTIDRRSVVRWAVFLAMILISFALYWAGTSAGTEIQVALLMLLGGVATLAASVR